jgi:tetratricopeptide (TPR) repeat protein
MFYPANLAIIYPRSGQAGLLWPTATALLVALSAGIFLLRKRHPYLWMGWLWNLGMLVPVSGIVQISRHWMADHYTYLPQIGLYIGLAWTAGSWAAEDARRRAVASGLAAGWVCALALAAFHYTAAWRDNISVWTHAIATTPKNYVAHSNLGVAWMAKGNHEEGFRQFQEALQIDPNAAIAHFNMGNLFFQAGRHPEAVAHFRAALAAWPEYLDARYSLGTALLQSGRTDEAVAELREVLRVSPESPGAHGNLAIALAQSGRGDEALVHFREAVRIDPANEEARFNLEKASAGTPGGGK